MTKTPIDAASPAESDADGGRTISFSGGSTMIKYTIPQVVDYEIGALYSALSYL